MPKILAVSPKRTFEAVGYYPHPGQATIHRSKARHRVASCGRRYGKTNVGGAELLLEQRRTRLLLPQLYHTGKRREFWIVGPEYTDAEKEFRWLYDRLSALGAPFDRPGTYYSAHDADLVLSMYGGKFLVQGKSAKHPERLVGEGLAGVIMAEAAKQRETTWTKYIRPTLADDLGWSLHTSTPEGRNWFYDLWVRGQSDRFAEWESWRRPAWLNSYVYPLGIRDPEVKSLREDLTEESFNQEIAAMFTEFAGRVFKEWDDEVHLKDLSYNPAWPVYGACDYGFTNPFVWLVIQVSPVDGTVYVIDEFYQDGLTIDEIAAALYSRPGLVPTAMREFFPDPASPGDSRVLEQRLRLRSRGGTGGELNDRLRLIRAALKIRNRRLSNGDSERRPKLFVDRIKCPNLVREMNVYRYPKKRNEADNNTPELPMKKDDHAPEALGRFYIGRFGRGGSQTVIEDADMSAA
jgi:hypothetical protein